MQGFKSSTKMYARIQRFGKIGEKLEGLWK
jgi:hypothetical protein